MLRKFFRARSSHLIVLAALTGVAFWFLSHNHGFASMWVEGMGECIETDLSMLGYSSTSIPCSLRLGSVSLPLSMNPHVGPAWYYFYAPTLYLWFNRVSNDPYIYRYTGIMLFIVNVWLLYFLTRTCYSRWLSFHTAVVFLSCPLFLLGTMTDYELDQVMLLFIFLTALLFLKFLMTGRVLFFLFACLTLGMNLLTRTETLLWMAIPFAVYLVLTRPPLVVRRWRELERKALVVSTAIVLFLAGASPVIARNKTIAVET